MPDVFANCPVSIVANGHLQATMRKQLVPQQQWIAHTQEKKKSVGVITGPNGLVNLIGQQVMNVNICLILSHSSHHSAPNFQRANVSVAGQHRGYAMSEFCDFGSVLMKCISVCIFMNGEQMTCDEFTVRSYIFR